MFVGYAVVVVQCHDIVGVTFRVRFALVRPLVLILALRYVTLGLQKTVVVVVEAVFVAAFLGRSRAAYEYIFR